MNVLQSESHASHCGMTSKGSGSSDGATVDLGDGVLQAVVLHSEGASGAKGASYLVSINGTEIGSSEQAGGSCALSVPSVLDLTCLTATGGDGSGNVLAEVAQLSALDGALGANVVFVQASPAGVAGTPVAEPAPALEPARSPG